MNQYINRPFLLSDTVCKFSVDVVPKVFFLRLLDAHDSGQEAGVPEGVFKAIFYVCGRCGRYMTERVSLYHHDSEGADSDDDDGDEQAACVYIHEGKTRTSKALNDGSFK